jgi:hypothetical protein
MNLSDQLELHRPDDIPLNVERVLAIGLSQPCQDVLEDFARRAGMMRMVGIDHLG